MKAHGSFELAVENRTMMIKIFGAWNYEAVMAFGAEYVQQVEKLNSEPWACVLDLSAWELVTPDVWEQAAELSKLSNDSNLKYYAVICSSNIQQVLISKNEESLTNVETKLFENMQQARAWLQEVEML